MAHEVSSSRKSCKLTYIKFEVHVEPKKIQKEENG